MTLTADPTAIVHVNPTTLTFNEELFQKMPQLKDEEKATLLEDIRMKGVQVPVEITADGVVVDGHNRVRLAVEAELDTIPAIVKSFDSDEEATAHVFAVNLQRRHLNQADKRKLVKLYLAMDPYKSNRQVAEDLGHAVTDKTVGAVRDEAEQAGEVEKATTRKGKDNKTRSTKKKTTKAGSERRKIEQERGATSAIRLGLEEAARVSSKIEGFSHETMLDILKGAPKSQQRLHDALASTLPIYLRLASALGVEGYEWVLESDEAEAPEADEAEAADSEGDAPF